MDQWVYRHFAVSIYQSWIEPELLAASFDTLFPPTLIDGKNPFLGSPVGRSTSPIHNLSCKSPDSYRYRLLYFTFPSAERDPPYNLRSNERRKDTERQPAARFTGTLTNRAHRISQRREDLYPTSNRCA